MWLFILGSNAALALHAYNVLRKMQDQDAARMDRVFVQPGEVKFVPTNLLETFKPHPEAFVLDLVQGAEKKPFVAGKTLLELTRAANHFLTSQLRSYTIDTFEAVRKYCTRTGQHDEFKKQPWYQFARLTRNGSAHSLRWKFNATDIKLLPVTWHGKTLTAALQDQPIGGAEYDWYDAIKLGSEVARFVAALK